MNRTVYLDFNGVILPETGSYIYKPAIIHFSKLRTVYPDLHICVSSAWRNRPEDVKTVLSDFKHHVNYSLLPYVHPDPIHRPKTILDHVNENKPDKWVVIDDLNFGKLWKGWQGQDNESAFEFGDHNRDLFFDHFVHCDSIKCFTEKNLNKAIKILK